LTTSTTRSDLIPVETAALPGLHPGNPELVISCAHCAYPLSTRRLMAHRTSPWAETRPLTNSPAESGGGSISGFHFRSSCGCRRQRGETRASGEVRGARAVRSLPLRPRPTPLWTEPPSRYFREPTPRVLALLPYSGLVAVFAACLLSSPDTARRGSQSRALEATERSDGAASRESEAIPLR